MSIHNTSNGNFFSVKRRFLSLITSELTLYHLQKWNPSVWIRGKGIKPDMIAKFYCIFFTRFELPTGCMRSKCEKFYCSWFRNEFSKFSFIKVRNTYVCMRRINPSYSRTVRLAKTRDVRSTAIKWLLIIWLMERCVRGIQFIRRISVVKQKSIFPFWNSRDPFWIELEAHGNWRQIVRLHLQGSHRVYNQSLLFISVERDL